MSTIEYNGIVLGTVDGKCDITTETLDNGHVMCHIEIELDKSNRNIDEWIKWPDGYWSLRIPE